MSKEIWLHCSINLIANVHSSHWYANTCDISPTCSCLERCIHASYATLTHWCQKICWSGMFSFKERQGTFKVFWPSLRFCCIGKSLFFLQPAVSNTCRCKHSCFSILQGFFFLFFCSSLRSFAWHLDSNAFNISPVVRLAPFIISRSPSAVNEKNLKYKVTTTLVCSCFVHINPNTLFVLSD